jgi:hypothetical protein
MACDSTADRRRTSDRRRFLQTLGLLPLWMSSSRASAQARADLFHPGWNHPWIGYGHDFGRAWGHDGLSTNGWTCETFAGVRGFTSSQVGVDPVSGRGALRIDCRLSGADRDRSAGAVSVSLFDHCPRGCPPLESASSVDLDGVLVRCRVRLPRGSAGSAAAPNYLQLFAKTRLTADRWPTLYTRPIPISASWEERYVDLAVRFDVRDAAHVDAGFELRNVGLIGMAMAAGSPSAAIDSPMWLDEFLIETDPPLLFDFERTECEAQFADVRRRNGFASSMVRFFIFCDGRAAPTFAPDGTVAGLDALFYRDFDVLLQAAAHHGVLVMPVLLDFGWCAYPRTVSGVQLGGHADVIRHAGKRRSFLDRALQPLLERYGTHPAIFAWDVCNEPEWAVDAAGNTLRERHDVVSPAEMQAFVRSCAEYVHRLTPNQLVTLGSARRMWLSRWTGCDLDLYQFHWYDHFVHEEPFPWRPYDELGLDKPCIVGEVPTAGTSILPQEFVAAAAAGRYSGVLFWSYGARDAASNMCSTGRPTPGASRPRRA